MTLPWGVPLASSSSQRVPSASCEAPAPPSAPHSPVFSCRPVCVPAPCGHTAGVRRGALGSQWVDVTLPQDAQRRPRRGEWGSGCELEASL